MSTAIFNCSAVFAFIFFTKMFSTYSCEFRCENSVEIPDFPIFDFLLWKSLNLSTMGIE